MTVRVRDHLKLITQFSNLKHIKVGSYCIQKETKELIIIGIIIGIPTNQTQSNFIFAMKGSEAEHLHVKCCQVAALYSEGQVQPRHLVVMEIVGILL